MKQHNTTWAALPAVGAALLLPIVYVPGVYDFTRWPRLLVLQAAVLAMFALWAVGKAERGSPARSIILSLFAFVLWQALSLLWAHNPVEALIRVNQLVAVGLFAGACAYLLNATSIHHVMRAASLSGTVVAVVCICQYWGWGFSTIPSVGQPSATFGYRNYLATYLIGVFPVIVAMSLIEASRKHQWMYGTAAAFVLAAVLCTRTRGAWVGLLAAGILFGAGSLATHNTHALIGWFSRGRTAACIVLLAAAMAIGLSASSMKSSGQFVFDEQKSDAVTAAKSAFSLTSARGRTTVWTNTLGMIADNPIFGVGLGGWQFAYPEYDRGTRVTTNVAPQRPHNDPIWILAETGVVGFGLYLALLISIIRIAAAAWRAGSPNAAVSVALALSLVAYTTHSLFSYPMERVASTALACFAIGGIAALNPESRASRIPRWMAYIAIALLAASLLLTWNRMEFDRHYSTAIEAWNRQDWSSVRQASERAIAVGPFDFRAYQLLGASNHALGAAPAAEHAYEASFKLHPHEGHLPLADLLGSQRRYSDAREHYRSEAALYPSRVTAHLGVAEMSRALGDWPAAANGANRVLALEETHPRALRLYADAAEELSDIQGARETFEKLLRSVSRDAETLAGYAAFLERQGDFNEALIAYEAALELAPAARYHNNRGVILTQTNKIGRAIEAFRDAVELDPGYARAYRNLGDLLARTGEIDGAITAYLAFIKHWQGAAAQREWAEQRVDILRGSM